MPLNKALPDEPVQTLPVKEPVKTAEPVADEFWQPGEDPTDSPDSKPDFLDRPVEATDYNPEDAPFSSDEKTGVSDPDTPEQRKTPEMIASAVEFGIPSDEIESMSAAELERAVRYVQKAATSVYEAVTKQAKAEPSPTPKANEDEEFEARVAKLKAEGYDEVFIENLRESRELKKINAALVERVKKLEDGPREAEQSAVQTRVLTVIKDIGLQEHFDTQKDSGKAMLRNLIGMAQKVVEADIAIGKTPTLKDEPSILRRAALALGLSPKRDNKAEIEKAKEKFANGSLATPRNRQTEGGLIGVVRKILSRSRDSGKEEPESTIDWGDG